MLQDHQTDVTMIQSAFTDIGDFQVNEIVRHSLHELLPLKKASNQHFSIILYYNDDCSKTKDGPRDNMGFLIFKSPGDLNKVIDHRKFVNGFYIQFTEKFLFANRPLLSIITGFPFFEISLLKNKPLEINLVQFESIKDLYKRIYEEYHCNCNNNELEIVNVYLQAFFLNIKRIYDSHSNIGGSENRIEKGQSREIVKRFKSLVWLDTIGINGKGLNRKTVTEYADLLFVHPNHLYAVVKKETGKTAREYIDEQIFKLAKTLLLQEELRIKEIAWQLSFNETAHFSNFFRRHAGVAPGEFRKQYLYAIAY